MERINNTTLISQFISTIPTLQNQLNKMMEEMENYLKFMKDEKFTKKENETKEESLRRAESMLDRIKEIVLRRQTVNKKSEEAIEMINEMKKKIEMITENCKNDDENLCDANNECIDEIIEIRRQIMEENIAPHQIEIEKYRNDFEMNKKELMKQMMETKEERRIRLEKIEREERERKEAEERRKREEMKRKLNGIVHENEKKQIEEWTNKKCSEILFDSDKDNWNQNTSVFDDRVQYKSNLIFVIEDTNNNKFGAFISASIQPNGNYTTDYNSFLFSLKSNGRLNGMQKFEIQSNNAQYACNLRSKSDTYLIAFGGFYWNICIDKENYKSQNSYCREYIYDYNYHGYQNTFLPNCANGNAVNYTPKRFVVIQMK